jgi:hypothetical protein
MYSTNYNKYVRLVVLMTTEEEKVIDDEIFRSLLSIRAVLMIPS